MFCVFYKKNKDCFSYWRVSQTVFDQRLNRTKLEFLVKVHWTVYPTWGGWAWCPVIDVWNTSGLHPYSEESLGDVMKAPLWGILWNCLKGIARMTLKIENTGKNFRSHMLEIKKWSEDTLKQTFSKEDWWRNLGI